MTRIFVPRGSSGSSSSSNQNRPPQASSSQSRDEEQDKDSTFAENPSITELTDQIPDQNQPKTDDLSPETNLPNSGSSSSQNPSSQLTESLSQINLAETSIGSSSSSSQPPAPPVPPPKPSQSNSNNNLRRLGSGTPSPPNNNNTIIRIGPSRRWAPQQTSSESDGYNSADEHAPSLKPSNYADAERERMFEMELRRVKGYEIRRMIQDGNCLFRAVADQVYGDPETYDLSRQMAVDYMERERDHFSQFITEGFTSYCKRKRRDKVYGNNVEIQAFAEMYNRPIHIYSYSTEPINIFQGSYDTDTPPIRLSYHHGNHYNSLIDPRRLNVGAGLGFSSLRGVSADRDQVKAAIKAQQDQHIDNALIAEGRFYSDMELTEKEIERMVMEASRAEYLKQQQQNQNYFINNSSGAEPSSSATIIGPSRAPSVERVEENINKNNGNSNKNNKLTGSMELLMAMGFSYMQVIEAYSIFGDDADSMICYLVEMGATSADSHRRKGKAAE